MSRLPTDHDDRGTWGAVLNDYLTETALHTTLASSPAAGATTFDVAVIPPGVIIGSSVVIDAFTTEAETRAITNISGNTVTVAATKYAHAAGDTVLVVTSQKLMPAMYGCTSLSAANWAPLQRMIIDAVANNLIVSSGGGGGIVAAGWAVEYPICVLSSSRWEKFGLQSHSTYAPAPDTAGALCMVASRQWAFTASASTNVFTVAAGHGMSSYSETNTTKIVFNAPYGETLPGNITRGKVYYIKTVPDTTTFTVSATPGGATLDVTSDGAGYGWESIEQLSRVYWDDVRFDVNKADVCGVRLNVQQPGYIRNIRVHMTAAATTAETVYGIGLGGQICYVDNVMLVVSGAKVTGCYLYGSGMTIRGFNIQGALDQDIGLHIANTWSASVSDIWTESCAVGVRITGGRGTHLGGSWLHGSAAGPALLVDSWVTPFEIGPIYNEGGSDKPVITYTEPALTFYTTGHATDPETVVTDYNGTFPGLIQPGSTVGETGPCSPQFKARVTRGISNADYSMRYVDLHVWMATGSSTRTVTLPPPTPLSYEYTVTHGSGAGTCTVVSKGAELIGGASSVDIPLGQTWTFRPSGSEYQIIQVGGTATGTYTPTNVSTDRAYDADTVLVAELADVVGTLIADLQARRLIG